MISFEDFPNFFPFGVFGFLVSKNLTSSRHISSNVRVTVPATLYFFGLTPLFILTFIYLLFYRFLIICLYIFDLIYFVNLVLYFNFYFSYSYFYFAYLFFIFIFDFFIYCIFLSFFKDKISRGYVIVFLEISRSSVASYTI